MWILESKGDFFQGRRMWMKPGKQYLFGRVKNNGVQFALAHKTVSRKHFIIKIDEVNEEDVAQIHTRSKVTIIDQKSKTGTVVNGEVLKDTTQELSRKLNRSENIIRVGGSEEEIVVRWQPCVLTFNLLRKEIKAGLLKTKQDRVRELDIKAVSDYLPGVTTHLVVNKRNTAKGLQALIDGTWLVSESWIDSFEYAATPADLDEEEHLSPLEQDSDKAWPDARAHLPPAGKEKTSRSVDAYEPDPGRKHIFENFTFVFGDQAQYDNLLPPITLGHGKALLFKVVIEETTADDLVTFLQKTAGNKGFGAAQRESDRGAVILIRWNRAEHEDWTNDLINQIALKLDQRVIDQSEFLDAILANNASTLRQSVPFESNLNASPHIDSTPASLQPIPQRDLASNHNSSRTGDISDSAMAPRSSTRSAAVNSRPEVVEVSNHTDDEIIPSATTQSQEDVEWQEHEPVAAQSDLSPEPQSVPIRRLRHTAVKPSSGGKLDFDDDFDPEAVIAYDSDSDNSDMPLHEQQETSVTPSSDQPGTPRGHDNVKAELMSSRKRVVAISNNAHNDTNEDGLDDILPGAAAMKRQKLSNEECIERTVEQVVKKPKVGIILPALSRNTKEIDVKEELRAKRAADREAAALADDDLDGTMEVDENGNAMVYDVRTEFVDLPVRKKSLVAEDSAHDDRWDPKWNGRKNFKAFRRARDKLNGADAPRQKPQNRVIVPLVDAHRVTYGIDDKYWERPEEDKELSRARKKRASQRTTQSQQASDANRDHQSQTVISSDIESDGNDPRNETHASSELTCLENERRHTRADNQPTQTSSASTSRAARTTAHTVPSKRPAGTINSRGNNAKKQKTLPVTTIHGSDSDDSDDYKFQFGKASRRRGKGQAGQAAVAASSS